MSYSLFIGDYTYSSWSLRGWLLLERFGIPFASRTVDFARSGVKEQLAALAPARTVPTLELAPGETVWDSLAMAEELASRHPDAGIWPETPQLRALARTLAAEMHSGFGALREACPMNLRCAYADVAVPEAVAGDLRRIETLWAHALERSGGPWLCGGYSAADAFFAPVAARIAGYGLAVSTAAQGYVAAHLADPAFRRWRAMGLVSGDTLPWYARDHRQVDWPGPSPRPARALEGPAAAGRVAGNAACPYSGGPARYLMEMDGRVYGFCNGFCRDKTVADPEVWPAFMALVAGARG